MIGTKITRASIAVLVFGVYDLGMVLLFRRYRWWVLAVVALLSIICIREASIALRPSSAWMHRGWEKMTARRYAEAEEAFRRARGRDADDPLPRIALIALNREWKSAPADQGEFSRVPFVGSNLAAISATRDVEARKRLAFNIESDVRWIYERYGPLNGAMLYAAYGGGAADELIGVMGAVLDIRGGQSARGRDKLLDIARRRPGVLKGMTRLSPSLLYYHACAAWRVGELGEARTLLTQFVDQMEFVTTSDPQAELLPPARAFRELLTLPEAAAIPRSRRWRTSGGALREDGGLADGIDDHVTLSPTPRGVFLLRFPPGKPSIPEEGIRWWEWRGGGWHEREQQDQRALESIWYGLSPGKDVSQTRAGYACGGGHEFLAVHVSNAGSKRAILLRIDGGVRAQAGSCPTAIVAGGGALWTREPMGIGKMESGAMTDYIESSVLRAGDPFSDRIVRSSPGISIDAGWQLAGDSAGNVWLAHWDGIHCSVKARWEGGRFRGATAAETAASREGFIDAGNRLWMGKELPAGFERDGWREAKDPSTWRAAQYARDGKGRVWVICDAVFARWEKRQWVSVARALPGLQPRCRELSAVGDGVMVVSPGWVTRVAN